MSLPKYLVDKIGISENTASSKRLKGTKAERVVAKAISGKLFSNSGATFGENDVFNDDLEVEVKTTSSASYSLKVSEMQKLKKKTKIGKIPIFHINFEQEKKQYAVIEWDVLLTFIKGH